MKNESGGAAAFNESYASLNAAQKKAVDTIEGPVMVVAGPGTGKTTMLTLRIVRILQETDIQPENILALTFTNSGVQAMREKLRGYIHDRAYRVGIYTFHSFAEHVLTSYSSYFPEFTYSEVIDDLEKVQLVENIIKAGSYQEIVSLHDPFSALTQILKAIDEIKKEGLTPDEFLARIPVWESEMMSEESMFYKRKFGQFNVGDVKPSEAEKVRKKVAKAKEVADVFSKYQVELKKRARHDFSDMIITVLGELERNDNLKLDLQEQYQYLLVDEHQDTNDGQNRLIELLTDAEHLGGQPNLFTVGDEKQSIYRFQGASAESFAHLQSVYKDVTVIELEKNYRSGRPVLEAAHELITNTVPEAKQLTPVGDEENPVSVLRFSDYKFELLYVVDEIKKHITKGVDPNEIAVIYRSNKHLAELKLILHELGVPYKVLSKDTLFDDPAIGMFIRLLRVVHDPYNDHELGKLLFADFLRLSALGNTKLLRTYYRKRRSEDGVNSLFELLEKNQEYASLLDLISKLKQYAANHAFVDFFREALHQSDFLVQVLKGEDSQSGLSKIDALFSEVKRQISEDTTYDLATFLAFVDAEAKYGLDIEVKPAGQFDGVSCLTAHKAKGLEFAHVYIINTTRNNWEKSRGFNQIALPIQGYEGDVDDERRLFYVAMTRAKTNLTISSAAMDWQGKPLEPSQFISELPDSSVKVTQVIDFERANLSRLDRFLSNRSETRSVFEPSYLAKLFSEENLSVTALNNYLECPIKYLFRNLIHLPDVYTPAQRYGDTLHKALEAFFQDSIATKKIGSLKSLLGHFQEAMKRSGFGDNEYERYEAQGLSSLTAYYDQYHDTWTSSVETEMYVRRSLEIQSGEELTLSGKIDKLEFLDGGNAGRVRVVDYKTGKTYSEKSSKEQKEALDRQIRFYHLLLQNYKDGLYKVEGAVLDFVEPNKKGQFEQKTFVVTTEEINKLMSEIESMATALRDGSFLKQGCGKSDCDHCAFQNSLSQ